MYPEKQHRLKMFLTRLSRVEKRMRRRKRTQRMTRTLSSHLSRATAAVAAAAVAVAVKAVIARMKTRKIANPRGRTRRVKLDPVRTLEVTRT